ncbi:MAG: hypothetical protein J1E28_06585 [Helicobacter sp.]|uniref:hypothetical protein n=1 Tax=Helicobacter sp. TaxID=218 RepID=UPI0025C3F976|nr:hypothetical protein [Helicobacter sp.]MCH5314038.1 hypothetical protein [Helicobacter sp.]
MANITRFVYVGIALVGIIALCGGAIAFMQGVESLASFEVGFVGFALVVGSSFIALFKRVKANMQEESQKSMPNEIAKQQESLRQNSQESLQEQNQELQKVQEEDKNTQFSTRFVIGAQMSLSFLRVVSYVLFGLMIILLLEHQLMSLQWFFIGLSAAMVVFVALGVQGIARTGHTKM